MPQSADTSSEASDGFVRERQRPAFVVTAALADRKAALESAALDAKLAGEQLDMTLPAAASPRGSVHPVSQVMDELAEIFADLGFAVATGPEEVAAAFADPATTLADRTERVARTWSPAR